MPGGKVPEGNAAVSLLSVCGGGDLSTLAMPSVDEVVATAMASLAPVLCDGSLEDGAERNNWLKP